MMERPAIALCFFGITRSLRHTAGSIMAHAVEPARQRGAVRLYGHFFDQPGITNPRSGENISGQRCEHHLLPLDQVEIATPDTPALMESLAALAVYGDTWLDGGRSLRNLVHQLHSLDRVTRMALAGQPQIILFLRPDLHYHDSLSRVIDRALLMAKSGRSGVFLPAWQANGGENDRFAVTVGEAAHLAYGCRLGIARAFCEETGTSLGSEPLVAFTLRKARLPVRYFPERASRVRANDTQASEGFTYPLAVGLQRLIDRHASRSFILPLHGRLTSLNFRLGRLFWGRRQGSIAPPPGVTQLTWHQQQALWRDSKKPPRQD